MKKIIDLGPTTIEKLQKLADEQKRPLKNYIEVVLNQHALVMSNKTVRTLKAKQ